MATIGRNATRKIAAIKALDLQCRVFSLRSDFGGPECDPEYAWNALALDDFARLLVSDAGDVWTVRVHDNLWYELREQKEASVEPGTGKPRAVDDDGHLWVEMEPDRWISWFDRRRYDPAAALPREELTRRWARINGLRPRAPYTPEGISLEQPEEMPCQFRFRTPNSGHDEAFPCQACDRLVCGYCATSDGNTWFCPDHQSAEG